MSQYAWLELDEGRWHFLTNLLAEPEDATRRWSDCQQALAELQSEGWIIVRPYQHQWVATEACEMMFVYGLKRQVH